MAVWEFGCSTPVDVEVEITAGTITITGAQTDTIRVRAEQAGPGWPPLVDLLPGGLSSPPGGSGSRPGDLAVDFDGGRLSVAEPSRGGMLLRRGGTDLVIEVPAGSRCILHAVAADIRCTGELGALDARTSSGSVTADTVRGPVQVSATSGSIRIEEAGGETALHTASGQIKVRHAAADITASAASGDIRIGAADGSVSAKTAVGRVHLDRVVRGRASVTTASGDISVGVAQGTGVYLDLSSFTGRVSSDLEPVPGDDQAELQLTCRTMTGSLHVTRADHAGVPG